MIRAVRSDHSSFKTATFKPGLNLVVAEMAPGSTDLDTRNGVGKSMLVETIHFCLGADILKDKGLGDEALAGWSFFIDLTLGGKNVTVGRSTAMPTRVTIQGDFEGWPIQPHMDLPSGDRWLSVGEWKIVLGSLLFGLPVSGAAREWGPSFRDLISYFIRRGRDAYNSPFAHHAKQKEWDQQVHNAFLLDLAWDHASRWQELRQRQSNLQMVRKAAPGLLPKLVGSVGEMEATKSRLEAELENEKSQLASFRIHPQYVAIEERATILTGSIHELSNENLADREMLQLYERSCVEEEEPTADGLLVRMYEQAGVVLPGQVVKRFEEVKSFHQQVIANRRSYLRAEMDRLKETIKKREMQIQKQTEERAGLLTVLKQYGALDEYTALQQLHAEKVSKLEGIRSRIETLKHFQQEASTIRIEMERLHMEALADYEDRATIRDLSMATFNLNSKELYEAPGNLVIDVAPTGFKFDIKIERAESEGVGEMKIFLYDLTIAELWVRKNAGPHYLMHDSTIYDPVDERQIASALQLADRKGKDLGITYVCCLNSERIPVERFDPDFDWCSRVCLRLTDSREDGGLFGIRFGSPEAIPSTS